MLPSYTGAVIANVVKGAPLEVLLESALVMGVLTLLRCAKFYRSAVVVFVPKAVLEIGELNYETKEFQLQLEDRCDREDGYFPRMLFGAVSSSALSFGSSLVTRRVQSDLYTALVRKDIAFFDSTKTGSL